VQHLHGALRASACEVRNGLQRYETGCKLGSSRKSGSDPGRDALQGRGGLRLLSLPQRTGRSPGRLGAGIMPRKGAARVAGGAVVEVRFADGIWYRGKLVERLAGSKSPRWRVQFDDGELRDDIRLGSSAAPVRFDASAYGSTVEVRFHGDRMIQRDLTSPVKALKSTDHS